MPSPGPAVTPEHRRQYRDEGYFVLERAVPPDQLRVLRDAADHLVRLADEDLDRKGVDRDHITHRGVRYHIAKKYHLAPRLSEFVFGDLMADVCRATVGDTAFLFYDQYVIKCADKGINFSWHQDSGYLGFPHRPYVTCWTAVDDMTLANGTARLLPYSAVGIRTLVEHVRDPETGDKVGYFGKEEGIPAVVPAGSVVVFSSLVFHSSGANTTDKMRRAYVTQYTAEPLMKPGGSESMHLAVPFLEGGEVVAEPALAGTVA